MPHEEASLLRRARVVQRSSCSIRRKASAACHAAHARWRLLSLGRRHTTRVCCARASCRADCGRRMPDERALRWREPSSPSARARGATCQLRPPTPSQRRVSCVAQARRRSAVARTPDPDTDGRAVQARGRPWVVQLAIGGLRPSTPPDGAKRPSARGPSSTPWTRMGCSIRFIR